MDRGKRIFIITRNDTNFPGYRTGCRPKQVCVLPKRNIYPPDNEIQNNPRTKLGEGKESSDLQKLNHAYNVSYWNGLHAFGVMIGCIAFSSIMTVLPQHNVIKEQWYWFELPICWVFGIWPTALVARMFESPVILNCSELKSARVMLDLVLTSAIAQFSITGILYLIWTQLLEMNYPVPFISYLSGYPVYLFLMIRLWFKFPKQMRSDAQNRKKLQFYFLYLAYILILQLQLKFLNKLCVKIRPNLQWIVAIVIPIVKEGNDWIVDKLVSKAFIGTDANDAKFIAKARTNCHFSFWLVLTVGTIASDFTQNCMLGINFGLHLLWCLRVIRNDRKVRSIDKEGIEKEKWIKSRNELLHDVLLSEIMEFIVPLVYMATFAMAYYGPNSELLGAVGNDYWHYKTVNDLKSLFSPAAQFLALDMISFLLTTILLWKFCSINAFQMTSQIFKKFWPILTLYISQTLNKVNKKVYTISFKLLLNNKIIFFFMNIHFILNFLVLSWNNDRKRS